MLRSGRLKLAKRFRDRAQDGAATLACAGKPWRNPAKAIGPKMAALAEFCTSYLHPLDTVERWSILD